MRTLGLLLILLLGIACTEPPTVEKKKVPKAADIQITTPKGTAIITNEDGQSISFVNISNQTTIKTIPVGKRPRGVKVVKSQNRAYVAVSGSPKCPPWISDEECAAKKTDKSADGIAEIDLEKMEVIGIIPSGSDPEQFDVSKDGKFLYIANEDVGKLSIVDINKKQIVKEVEVSEEPEGVRVSPNGKIVAVTCEEEGEVALVDTENHKLLVMVKVGKRPRDLVYTKDSKTLYITCEASGYVAVLDIANQKVVKNIPLGKGNLPVGVVLSDDEKHLYIAGGRGKSVVKVDIEAGEVLKRVKVEDRPWGLDKDLNEKLLISANGGSGDISFIDIRKFEVVKTLKVGKGTWGVYVY